MRMGGQRHAPAALPGTHCIGGWVGPRVGLDGCGISCPPPGYKPQTVKPVASRYTDWAVPAYLSTSSLFFFCGASTRFRVMASPYWASRSFSLDTPPDNIQHSQGTNIHVPGGIRTHNPSKRAAADPRLKPRGHWDRHKFTWSCQLV